MGREGEECQFVVGGGRGDVGDEADVEAKVVGGDGATLRGHLGVDADAAAKKTPKHAVGDEAEEDKMADADVDAEAEVDLKGKKAEHALGIEADAVAKKPAKNMLGVDADAAAKKTTTNLVGDVVIPKSSEAAAAEEVLPNLDLDNWSVIAAAMPTRAAYRLSIMSRVHHNLLSEAPFFMSHLALRRLLIGDGPGYIIVQPADHAEYTHLTLAKVKNVGAPLFFNLPVKDPDSGEFEEYPLPTLLNAVIIASHGRLLLARSGTSNTYFVCNSAENRWVKLLPPGVTMPLTDTAAGLRYELGNAGKVCFEVVLLVRHNGGVLVQRFRSGVASWEEVGVGVDSPAATVFPPSSPGIAAGNSIYWPSTSPARLVAYDTVTGHFAELQEPPVAPEFPLRAGRSLGSAGGLLRFCACDVDDSSANVPDIVSVQALFKIWLLNDISSEWVQTHHVLLPEAEWMVNTFHGLQLPLDLACASCNTVIVTKSRSLLARDLDSGELVANLRGQDALHQELYERCNLFPFFSV